MFTGIVQAVGRIAARIGADDGLRLRVDAAALGIDDVRVGDSIAVAGCCLTVVDRVPPFLDFDVSGETLRCTTGFAGERVNLEKALQLSDRLGGHLLSGHVDGVGEVIACGPASGADDANRQIEIEVPAALSRYVAPKGSIAIDGVSLTTNRVQGARFTINLIPHTLAVTTLGALARGARVNVEVDLLARYVERLLADRTLR